MLFRPIANILDLMFILRNTVHGCFLLTIEDGYLLLQLFQSLTDDLEIILKTALLD
jgi:hypothetical protein